jgi:hypothetical protein
MSSSITAQLKQAIVQIEPVSKIRSLIINYLESRGSATAVLWHPLGFIDIPIERNHAGKLVIHVWHPDLYRPQLPQQICHSHGWVLRSAVPAVDHVQLYEPSLSEGRPPSVFWIRLAQCRIPRMDLSAVRRDCRIVTGSTVLAGCRITEGVC